MLTLVLTLAMLLSVMVVGAGAATFSDQDSIKNTEAVDACTSLSIIGGYEDGTFRPNGNVTRAEMCKMICVALNGGREPTLGNISSNTFTDTQGHWAAPYIEYCVKNGVVAGIGGGRFDPDGAVTGTQAAKMLLVAMGFNPVYQHYVGSDAWELNINSDAFGKGLYTRLESIDTAAALSRDNAAQLIYNAVDATMVWYDFVPQTVNGAVTMVPQLKDMTRFVNGTENECSIFTEKYEGVISEGVLTASGKYAIAGGSAGADTLSMRVEKINGASCTPSTQTLTWKNHDLTDLVGQYAKILHDSKTGKVYGVFAVPEENTLDIETTVNNVTLSDGKIKVNDTKYDYNTGAIVYVDGGAGQTVAASSAYIASTAVAKADNIRLISNDGDNEIDVILINTIAVTDIAYVGGTDFSVKVPAVGSRTVDTDGVAGAADYAKASQKLDDVDVYSGITQDDYVILSENYYAMKDSVSKITVSEGTITGTKGTNEQWQIDGTWYKPYAGYTGMNVLDNGDTLKYIAIDGIVYYAEKTTENSVRDIAAVITVGQKSGTTGVDGNTLEAKLLLSDGTKKTVTVAKVDSAKVSDNIGSATTAATTLIGDLVVYKVNNDGEYELTSIPNNSTVKSAIANYDRSLNNTAGKEYVAADKTIAGFTLADDAVVFVVNAGTANTANSANDGKVFTGKEIKRLNANFGVTATSIDNTPGLVTVRNGIQEVAVAVLSTSDAIPTLTGAGTSYGYLTAGSYWTHDTTDGKDYNVYTYWNGSDVVTSKEESTSKKAFAAGQVIGFDTVGNDIIKNVAIVGATGKVSGYNESDNVVQIQEIGSVNYKLTKDTTILYVDTNAEKGVTGGKINLASDTDGYGTRDVNNVLYIVTPATNEVELLVVDVNNKYETSSAASTSGLFANLATMLKNYDVVEVTDAVSLSAGLTIPVGKTVIFSNTLNTNSNDLTVNGTMTVSGAVTGPEEIRVSATGTLNLSTSACTKAVLDGITYSLGATVTVDTAISDTFANVYTTVGTAATTDAEGNPVAEVSGTKATTVAANATLIASTVYDSGAQVKLLVK